MACFSNNAPTLNPYLINAKHSQMQPSSTFVYDWGMYGGYMLDASGCYRHGTFMWSGSPSNYVFIADNGCNNSGACSTGFEDFCMDDEEFSALC
jgi:hypothetical protein